MVTQRVMLRFPADTFLRPVFGEIGQRFPLVQVTLCSAHADRNGNSGWMILEVTGEKYELTTVLDWVKQQGVRVDSMDEVRKAS